MAVARLDGPVRYFDLAQPIQRDELRRHLSPVSDDFAAELRPWRHEPVAQDVQERLLALMTRDRAR